MRSGLCHRVGHHRRGSPRAVPHLGTVAAAVGTDVGRGVGSAAQPCAVTPGAWRGTNLGYFTYFQSEMLAVLCAKWHCAVSQDRGVPGAAPAQTPNFLSLCQGCVKQQQLLIAGDISKRRLAAGILLHAVPLWLARG